MKGKSLAILAGVVVILGAFIWFFERHQLTTEEARASEGRIFGALEAEGIVSMEIINTHGRFGIRRQGPGWQLTEPIEEDADQAAVDAALRMLVQLNRDRVLDRREVDPATYGLDDPAATVTLNLRDGRTLTLNVGNPTPLDSRRAVALNSENVILTEGSFFPGVNKGLDDWRSKTVVEVTLGQLAAMTVRVGSGAVEAINLGETWSLRAPVIDRADRDHLQNLVSGLNGLRVEEFSDATVDLEAMGLLDPRTTVLLMPADGSPGISLDFGATRQSGGATQVACRRNGRDVFWVNDRAANALGKAPVLWRDPAVLSFNTWEVDSFEVTEGSVTARLEKADGVWKFSDGGEADTADINKRLDGLASLTVDHFDLMKIGTPELGRVVIGLENGGTPLTITFFEPLENGGDVLVTTSDRETVMGVDPTEVQAIIGNQEALHPAEEEADLGVDTEP